MFFCWKAKFVYESRQIGKNFQCKMFAKTMTFYEWANRLKLLRSKIFEFVRPFSDYVASELSEVLNYIFSQINIRSV